MKGTGSARNSKQKDAALKAAIYVRMSTDHQRYSIENQITALSSYAVQNQLTIVASYIDEAKSGLTFSKRPSLKKLINDVKNGEPIFGNILVLDVSRWGRFQDVDEGAYYEYFCRNCGIQIHYTAEQFGIEGSPYASILKTLKRVMAAEYSRDLSLKVVRGQRALAAKGFHLGGAVPYGLRRMLLDENGLSKRRLKAGERKASRNERIRLVPGPKYEQAVVNWIYDKFLHENIGELELARILNKRGISATQGRKWTRDMVSLLLTNEKYVGHLVVFKKSAQLGTKLKLNPTDVWVRANNAIPQIVNQNKFDAVQEKLKRREEVLRSRLTNEELLVSLKLAYRKYGKLSYEVLAAHHELPSLSTYRTRFGSMSKVYDLIGYKICVDGVARKRRIKKYKKIVASKITAFVFLLKKAKLKFDRHSINGITIIEVAGRRYSFLICPCYASVNRNGPSFWRGNVGMRSQISDFIIVLELDDKNSYVRYFYLIKSENIGCKFMRITSELRALRKKYLWTIFKMVQNAPGKISELAVGTSAA